MNGIKGQAGFTLIEMLIVLGLTSILVALSFPMYRSLQTFQPLHLSRTDLVAHLRLAQEKARQGEQNSNFGVLVATGAFTLYRGSSFAGRVATDDRLVSFLTQIESTGTGEVNFFQKSGLPNSPKTFTLSHLFTGDTETVTVEGSGLIH